MTYVTYIVSIYEQPIHPYLAYDKWEMGNEDYAILTDYAWQVKAYIRGYYNDGVVLKLGVL